MIYDILRFNIFALDLLEQEEGKVGKELSIGDYLEREGYGEGFKEDYLLVSLISGLNRACRKPYLIKDYTAYDGRYLVDACR